MSVKQKNHGNLLKGLRSGMKIFLGLTAPIHAMLPICGWGMGERELNLVSG